jgi:anti-sigma factor RsiW
MRDCPEPRDLLAAYVDGALDPATTADLAAHIAGCARCQADVAAQQQMKQLLAQAPPLPAGLAERVRTRTYAPAPSDLARRPLRPVAVGTRRSLPALRRWTAVPAFVALLLVIMLGMSAAHMGPFAPSRVAAATEMAIKDHLMCEQMGGASPGLPGDSAAVQAALGVALGMATKAPTQMPPGYHFAGGHEVDVQTTHAGHMMWIAAKRMLSFYQAPDPGGDPPTDWQPIARAGQTYWRGGADSERALFWRANGQIYLLVGSLTDDELLAVAGSVK